MEKFINGNTAFLNLEKIGLTDKNLEDIINEIIKYNKYSSLQELYLGKNQLATLPESI